MDEAKVIPVIITNLRTRGKGTETSPVRIIKEVYSNNSELIADNDPYEYTIETIMDFLKWHYKEIPESTHAENIFHYFVEERDS